MFRALLIDDERLSLVAARHSVDWPTWGIHEVLETTHPQEALRWLATQHIDVAFVDIRMPEMSGLQLIERLGASETTFVMLTGYSDFAYARQALQLSVFDYCLKPLQPEEVAALMPRLQKALCAKRLARDPARYAALRMSERPLEELARMGLCPTGRFLSVIALRAQETDCLTSELCGSSAQATLLVGGACALKWISTEEDPSDCIRMQYEAVAEPPLGAAICTMESGRADRALKRLLPHALTVADFCYQQSLERGRVQVQRIGMHAGQTPSDDFLMLLEEVERRYTEDLSLGELAQQHYMNYSYCSTLFSQHVGVPFSKYLTTLRLKKAQQLLVDTQYAIGDISQMVGYNHYNHFVMAFKKAYQTTPSQYREAHAFGGGQ